MSYNRKHLIEIHEQSWCPKVIRDGITGILQFIANTLPSYGSVLPQLQRALAQTDSQRIIDLCAGSGGPWKRLLPKLRGEEQLSVESVLLTDKFPRPEVVSKADTYFGSNVYYHEHPIDAVDVPDELNGFRTIFAAFHHFEPQRAEKILSDAMESKQGIGIFELTERTVPTMLFIALTSLIWGYAGIFFARPFKWLYFPLTFILPIIPIVLMIDGLVSCMRTYHVDELELLTQSVDPHGTYEWDIGRVKKGGPLPVIYLIGTPKA